MTDLPNSLWPGPARLMDALPRAELLARVEPRMKAYLARSKLDHGATLLLEALYLPLAAWVAQRRARARQPLVLGLAGAQGTGKSTLAGLLAILLADGFGLRSLRLSLDDFYLTRAERERLARQAHPLLRTRGVPGTHDVTLLASALAQLRTLRAGERVTWPAFDKATDDRCPRAQWNVWEGPIDVVVFEGWCVGARAEAVSELVAPINALERDEDPAGGFRSYVNTALEGPYAALFAQLDALVFLAAPDMQAVLTWRMQQEVELASAARASSGSAPSALSPPSPSGVMNAEQLARFVQHFERVTRHMLAETPARAEVVLRLGRDHACEAVSVKS